VEKAVSPLLSTPVVPWGATKMLTGPRLGNQAVDAELVQILPRRRTLSGDREKMFK